MANTTKSIDQILASDELTAYEVYRVLVHFTTPIDSKRAASLKPQMMYNYTRNGLIVKGKKGSGSDIRYTVTETLAFVSKWAKKNLGVDLNNTTPTTPKDNSKMQSAARG